MEKITFVEVEVEAKFDVMRIKKGERRFFPYVKEDMIHKITGELWEIIKSVPKK